MAKKKRKEERANETVNGGKRRRLHNPEDTNLEVTPAKIQLADRPSKVETLMFQDKKADLTTPRPKLSGKKRKRLEKYIVLPEPFVTYTIRKIN